MACLPRPERARVALPVPCCHAVDAAHGLVFLVYLAMRFHETTDAHSGYDFPWSPWRLLGSLHGGARRHDWHHSHVNGNFGGFWFWDWLCETDKEYYAWEARRLQKKANSIKADLYTLGNGPVVELANLSTRRRGRHCSTIGEAARAFFGQPGAACTCKHTHPVR